MRHSPITFLFICLALSIKCEADFFSPASHVYGYSKGNHSYNPSYAPGQFVYIEWASHDEKSWLYLGQVRLDSNGDISKLLMGEILENTDSKSHVWEVDLASLDLKVDLAEDMTNIFCFVTTNQAIEDSPSDINYTIAFNITMPEGGLSTGAIVGITFGSTIGGLLVTSALGYLAWRCFRICKNIVAWYGSRQAEVERGFEEYQPEIQPSYNMAHFTDEQLTQSFIASPQTPKPELPIERSKNSPQTQNSGRGHHDSHEIA